MKKLIGVLALVITANISLFGFQSYSNRDEPTQLAILQERLQLAESKVVERDAAIKELHVSVTRAYDNARRNPANTARDQYRTLRQQWASVDQAYTAEVRAYNMLADSVRLVTAK